MGKINKTDRLILDNNFIPYVDRFIKMDLVYQLIYYFNLYMMKEPTKEQWQAWYAHKSNKEAFIEAEEARQDEIQEESTSMEEKLKKLSTPLTSMK